MAKKHAKQASKRRKSRAKHEQLPRASAVIRGSVARLYENRAVVARFSLLYAILFIVLVQGVSFFNVSDVRTVIQDSLGTDAGGVITDSLVAVTVVDAVSGGASTTSLLYATGLFTIFSLAFIWILRHWWAGSKQKDYSVKMALYEGMNPLVPSIILGCIALLQTLPLGMSSFIVTVIQAQGAIATAVGQFAMLFLLCVICIATLFYIVPTILGVYIASLPGVAPLAARKQAADLLRGQRWAVLRKLLAVYILLGLINSIILILIVSLLTPIAVFFFIFQLIFNILLMHTINYSLYRHLLS